VIHFGSFFTPQNGTTLLDALAIQAELGLRSEKEGGEGDTVGGSPGRKSFLP